MTSLFNEKIVTKLLSSELSTPLSQNNEKDLQYKIATSRITDYDAIKTLAKDIKTYLLSKKITLQHSKILNILAKSYGFSNHHSLSAEFKIMEPTFEANTQLSRLFQARKEIFQYFKANNLEFFIRYIDNENDKFNDYITFFYLPKSPEPEQETMSFEEYLKAEKEYTSFKQKAQIDVNKILKKYKIISTYNSINLFKGKHNESLIYEIQENYSSSLINSIRHHDILLNFLNFLFLYGDVYDLLFIEKVLQNPDIDTFHDLKHIFSKELKVRKYNKFKFQEDFMNEYKYSSDKNLKKILYKMNLPIRIPNKITKLLRENEIEVKNIKLFEDEMLNLSEFIKQYSINFYNTKNRYFKIQEELYYQVNFCDDEKEIAFLMDAHNNNKNILVSFLAQCIENTIISIKEISEKNHLRLLLR